MGKSLIINSSADASGAQQAGKEKKIVVIVDVIDMSTTLEAALDAGALAVFGACPDNIKIPVAVDPFQIGLEAGALAKNFKSSVIIVAEPRWGNDEKRLKACQSVILGLAKVGVFNWELIPNIGISAAKLVNFKNKIVIAVTHSGGVAYDAAKTAGGTVLTATIARTWLKKGLEPAKSGVKRALKLANQLEKDLCFVAASSNSMEDILASQFLTQLALFKR